MSCKNYTPPLITCQSGDTWAYRSEDSEIITNQRNCRMKTIKAAELYVLQTVLIKNEEYTVIEINGKNVIFENKFDKNKIEFPRDQEFTIGNTAKLK